MRAITSIDTSGADRWVTVSELSTPGHDQRRYRLVEGFDNASIRDTSGADRGTWASVPEALEELLRSNFDECGGCSGYGYVGTCGSDDGEECPDCDGNGTL